VVVACGKRSAPARGSGTARALLLAASLLASCSTREEARATEGAREPLRHAAELVASGELDQGIRLLQELARAPDLTVAERVELHSQLGHAQARARRPDLALLELEVALEGAPDDAWLHYAAGVARTELGELEAARASFDRALELDPRHLKALQWRSEVRHDLRDLPGARADLDRALACIEAANKAVLRGWGGERRALLRWTLERRAEVLEQLGEGELARTDRERSLKLATEDGE